MEKEVKGVRVICWIYSALFVMGIISDITRHVKTLDSDIDTLNILMLNKIKQQGFNIKMVSDNAGHLPAIKKGRYIKLYVQSTLIP